jgi:predicted porin
MKLPAVALVALALVSGTASAQTNVTFYGIVDIGVKRQMGLFPAGSVWSVAPGQQSVSRFGFRGVEDLGGGLSANFVLENGFNADDGTFNNGGRLFGRQMWAGLKGGAGAVYLGRQYSAIYNALNAIDPFGLNQAGDAQRVYGYGLGKVDPISRSDNTITYTTPSYNGWTGQAGYKFGEVPGSLNTDSSKFAGLAYVNDKLNFQAAYQITDGVALGANTTQLGAIVAPAGLGYATAAVRNTFVGATYDWGLVKAHLAFGDSKVSAAVDTTIRNYLAGASVKAGTGTAYASWNRSDLRNLPSGASDQYAVGYPYPFSKRTNFYSSASYTRNGSNVRLNAATNGESGREFQAGIRHLF